MDEVTADTSLLMGTPPVTERVTAVRFYKKTQQKGEQQCQAKHPKSSRYVTAK
jgi:hypothetical protein